MVAGRARRQLDVSRRTVHSLETGRYDPSVPLDCVAARDVDRIDLRPRPGRGRGTDHVTRDVLAGWRRGRCDAGRGGDRSARHARRIAGRTRSTAAAVARYARRRVRDPAARRRRCACTPRWGAHRLQGRVHERRRAVSCPGSGLRGRRPLRAVWPRLVVRRCSQCRAGHWRTRGDGARRHQ